MIGMVGILRQHRAILLVHPQALIAWIVAVAGATVRSSVEYRVAATTFPTNEASATLAFV